MCSLTLAPPLRGGRRPQGAPFKNLLLKIIFHLHFKTPPIEIAQKTSKITTFSFNLYRTGFETHLQNHFKIVDISIPSFHTLFPKCMKSIYCENSHSIYSKTFTNMLASLATAPSGRKAKSNRRLLHL
jgi:hypothetical protein